MRYLLVSRGHKLITNAIELDPRSINYSGPVDPDIKPYSAPENMDLIADPDGDYHIGEIYEGGI